LTPGFQQAGMCARLILVTPYTPLVRSPATEAAACGSSRYTLHATGWATADFGELDHQKLGHNSRFVYDRGNKIFEKSTTGGTEFFVLTGKMYPKMSRVTANLTALYCLFTLGIIGQCLMENKKEISRDLFPGALEMMILESLRRQSAHGYALVQHIQQRSKNLLQVEEGSLYPALQRLLKTKMVKAEWTVSPSTNRRVRIYQITKDGLQQLEREISSFDRMLEGIQMVLGPARRATNS
jgi:PadR family transcriptional regulator, regulatory protein PadR